MNPVPQQLWRSHKLVRMNPDSKNLICRVLRSDRYQQGTEFSLTSRNTCVGGLIMQTYLRMHGLKGSPFPAHYLAWMGMTDKEMEQFADQTEDWNKRHTFREIADLIEQQY